VNQTVMGSHIGGAGLVELSSPACRHLSAAPPHDEHLPQRLTATAAGAILAISAFAQGECRSAGEQVQLLYKWAREKAENGKESSTTAAAELLGTRDEPALTRGQEV
jgi:hypothetical protein